MEVMDNEKYQNLLIDLLDNNNINLSNNNIKLNLYLTLLTLNNNNYTESIYQKELSIIEDFLRKINNLKVKIQLKRKESEIDSLIKEINSINENNSLLIREYNKDNLDIDNIINSKNPQTITKLIDNLTKEKIKLIDNKDYYDNLRNIITTSIFESNYYLDNNTLYLDTTDLGSISIPITDFFNIFSYLLNISNYPQTFINKDTDNLHKSLIKNIINLITSNQELNDNIIISLILTNIIPYDIPSYNDIDTSCFNIDNIRITDLYEIAGNNSQITNKKTAKWKKILIPNEYLYQKMKENILKGMYYFKDNFFILEHFENNISDFKISININNMKNFLKSNLNNLKQNKKHNISR